MTTDDRKDPTEVRFDAGSTNELCDALAVRLSPFEPTVVIGLARKGFYCAARLATALGIEVVIGQPVSKIGSQRDLLPAFAYNHEHFAGKVVIGVDDTIVTGRLLSQLGSLMRALGATYYPTALVGVGDYPRLDGLMVATELPAVPSFFMDDLRR